MSINEVTFQATTLEELKSELRFQLEGITSTISTLNSKVISLQSQIQQMKIDLAKSK